MKKVLFLSHRIPYPPNKGDKIRSYNLFRHLAKNYQVYLGAFVDDPADWQYAEKLKSLCTECCFLNLNPRQAKMRSLTGFVTGNALTVPYYRNRQMGRWVDQLLAGDKIDAVIVFSSAMAQYVSNDYSGRKIIDFVDVDSDKWRQYAERKKWPESWVYRREGQRLYKYDRAVANRFDWSVFVSEDEASLFRGMAPEVSERITHIDNGVDIDYFSDQHPFVNPYRDDEYVFVFTGAMDYWANENAVSWFADEVFPEIKMHAPAARFYIVGIRPTDAVCKLARDEQIVVTGAVDDIRPYVKYATVSVATLRIARGVQNKVLEAMAMGKPILATTLAMEGIRYSDAMDLAVSDDPNVLAREAIKILKREKFNQTSLSNRECVKKHYSWDKNLEKLDQLLN